MILNKLLASLKNRYILIAIAILVVVAILFANRYEVTNVASKLFGSPRICELILYFPFDQKLPPFEVTDLPSICGATAGHSLNKVEECECKRSFEI